MRGACTLRGRGSRTNADWGCCQWLSSVVSDGTTPPNLLPLSICLLPVIDFSLAKSATTGDACMSLWSLSFLVLPGTFLRSLMISVSIAEVRLRRLGTEERVDARNRHRRMQLFTEVRWRSRIFLSPCEWIFPQLQLAVFHALCCTEEQREIET